jgi:hypothetical protein
MVDAPQISKGSFTLAVRNTVHAKYEAAMVEDQSDKGPTGSHMRTAIGACQAETFRGCPSITQLGFFN